MMPSILSLFFALLIFFSFTNTILAAGQANESEIDRHALLCFKSGINSYPLGILDSWSKDSLSFCSWKGVTCGTNSPLRVVSLDLTSAQISGQISSCLADLTFISSINLGGNHLSGMIPEELGKLSNLHTLNLAGSNLEGNIPDSLGTINSLSYINLANNTLTGGIPLSLASGSSLSTLILSRNNLSGEIPSTLFDNSSKLSVVDLQMNSFIGAIPPFHKVTYLKFLCLKENFLSGSIPPSVGNISSATSILLGQNKLSGLIPKTLGRVTKLLQLDLSYNSLSGNFPLSLFNIKSLEYLSVGSNGLVGQIPSHIGYSLPNLQSLIMGSNRLEGLIPASLANMSNLQMLDLSNNFLHGSLPSLGSLTNLHRLVLGRNLLEAHDWSFLTALANCTQLIKLSLEGNALNGSLPIAVVNLSTRLEDLSLGSNQISGSIPVEISNLVSLTSLRVESNFLSGSIPSTIGKLQSLYILNLSKNNFSGQIPTSVGDITKLGKLYLDDNNLTGNIPGSLGQCKGLLELNLSTNSLDGSIPVNLFAGPPLSLGVDFSYNKLTGEIPLEVGLLKNLVLLNVSNNLLFGPIPENLGQCTTLLFLRMERNKLQGKISQSFEKLLSIQQINLARNDLSNRLPVFFGKLTLLEKLDLSYNNFQGDIPESFSALKAVIQHIDMSENNLTGQVPQFLGNFGSVNYINISYNKFEGSIPTGGIFGNSTAVFLQGNTGLCETTAPIFGLPICPTTSATKWKTNARLLLTVTPLITVSLFAFYCVVVTVKKGTKTQSSENFKETMKRVSYGDILKATNCFSLVSRISSTHTASVYIGRFEFETDLVAIKVFHLSEQGSKSSFFTELEMLKYTRHRNLVQAITLCSTVDYDNNEFKAIVYQFVANGNLDMWIHPRLHRGSPRRLLSLGQRISIAADVASAMDYLHNQLTPPMIHCDLKPSNVLLDYDMTSRIGDFGSAKFLSSSLGLAGVGGTIGYIAPEYGMGCEISTGGDVYSFGVLLLEMLTAVRPTDAQCGDALSLHKYVDLAFPDRIAEVIDPHMPSDEDEVAASIRTQMYILPLVSIGLMCSMESPKDRPGMNDVCAKIVAVKEAFVETL